MNKKVKEAFKAGYFETSPELAEIKVSYKTKNYSDAISYYKESGTRNETATYMPTLMLHTAVAMQKTKDNDTAKKFLGALITNYPKSSEAKDAKKILSSLK